MALRPEALRPEAGPLDWRQEGKAQFQTGTAFFRPQAATARDLGVLAAAVYRQQHGHLRVLDAMSGCGVRSLRYALEAAADFVWANEANPDHGEILQRNLQRNLQDNLQDNLQAQPARYQITHQDAVQVLAHCLAQRDFYDLVDLDAFGQAADLLQLCLGAVRVGGLVYFTATDGRSLAGHAPTASLRAFGAYARSHPSCQEQGLRILLGTLLQQATARGFDLQPVFSYFNGQTYRVMVRLVRSTPQGQARKWVGETRCAGFPNPLPGGTSGDRLGFLAYCHRCGNYQTVPWRNLGRITCIHTDELDPVTPSVSGPLWLGPLHSVADLQAMQAIARHWHWNSIAALLDIMSAEAALPPFYFPLGEIGRRGKLDPPKRDTLLQALQAQGYAASPTHIRPDAIKTTASLQACINSVKLLKLLQRD